MGILFGAIGAVLTVLYWGLCRKTALPHQTRLGDLMVAYMGRDDLSDPEKNSVYWIYRLSRTWFFMPVMAVLSVIAVVVAIVTARLDAEMSQVASNTDRNDIMDAAVAMYMSKNPLTAFVFMTGSLVLIGIALPFGFIFKRLKSIPGPMSIYNLVAAKASSSIERHAL